MLSIYSLKTSLISKPLFIKFLLRFFKLHIQHFTRRGKIIFIFRDLKMFGIRNHIQIIKVNIS